MYTLMSLQGVDLPFTYEPKDISGNNIDVAVLTRKFIGDIGDSFDFKFLLMKIAREMDFKIELHPYLVSEFTEDNPFTAEIRTVNV